jgi:exodeoxyribonuclease V alpha subunit
LFRFRGARAIWAFNRDLGVVSRIDTELTVDFEGCEVTYGFGELDELVLAYGARSRAKARSTQLS